MSDEAMRINARIDAELARKVATLQQKTGASVTAIVREALELYYEREMRAGGGVAALGESEFVGCADGPSDLSTDYKRYLTESLSRKSR